MHPNLRKSAVNWIDGMKVNKMHFQQTEEWIIDYLKDVVAINLNDYNYGLLPSAEGEDTSLNLQVEVEQTQFVRATLLSCRAVTRGGIRIEITPFISKQFNLDKSLLEVNFNLKEATNQQYDIVVTVNPFSRIPAGDPDPDEHPLRHPFSLPNYTVDVIPSSQINTEEFSTYHLTLGRFRVVAGEVQVMDYVPPCTQVLSHLPLVQKYREFEKLLYSIRNNLTQYIKKTRGADSNSVNHDLLALAESTLMSIAIFQDEFAIDLPHKPPVELFKFFVRFVRLVSTELNCMPEDDRLLVYKTLNQNFAAGTFENTITAVLDLKYSHREIYQTLDKLHAEVAKIDEIVGKLPLNISSTHYQPPQQPAPSPPPPPTEEPPKKSGPTVKIFRGGQRL